MRFAHSTCLSALHKMIPTLGLYPSESITCQPIIAIMKNVFILSQEMHFRYGLRCRNRLAGWSVMRQAAQALLLEETSE